MHASGAVRQLGACSGSPLNTCVIKIQPQLDYILSQPVLTALHPRLQRAAMGVCVGFCQGS